MDSGAAARKRGRPDAALNGNGGAKRPKGTGCLWVAVFFGFLSLFQCFSFWVAMVDL